MVPRQCSLKGTKFCISIVFVFSWDHCKSQGKLETMLMQNLGRQTKSIMVFSGVAYLFCLHKQRKHHSSPQSCNSFSQRHGFTSLVGTLCMEAHNVSQMCLLEGPCSPKWHCALVLFSWNRQHFDWVIFRFSVCSKFNAARNIFWVLCN